LRALGLSREDAGGSLRIGLGRPTTDDDVDLALNLIVNAVVALRAEKESSP
jgi:cysteine sulfinate desulfinase/cysteine desulfurase-like protein